MQTVKELCAYVGWGITDLARQAGISYDTAKKAYDGEMVSNRVRRAICSAFSAAMGRQIQVGDINW